MVDALEVATDAAQFFDIVYLEVYLAFEDAVVGLDVEAGHVDVALLGQYCGDAEQYANGIDALDVHHCREEQSFVHVPVDGQQVVAVAGLQAVGFDAVAFMYGHLAPFVDVSQHDVARYGMTLWTQDALADVFFVDCQRFLAVNLSRFLLLRCCWCVLVALEEWDVFAPLAFPFLFTQACEVLWPKVYHAATNGDVQFFACRQLVQGAQFVGKQTAGLHIGLLQELRQYAFALALSFAVLASQEGLYLVLGLGRCGELEPFATHL